MFKKKKSAPAEFAGEFTSTVSGVETVTKKKKGKKIAIISGVTAVALIGGGIAAFNFSDLVQNQVRLRVMKPQNYYSWVNEKNAQSLAEKISARYSTALDRYKNGQQSSASIKYVPSETAKDEFLKSLLGSDYKNTDDSDYQQIINLVEKNENYKLGIDSLFKDGVMQLNLYGDVNDERLTSLEYIMDIQNFDFFLRIPELTEKYLGFEMGDYLNEALEEEDEETQAIMDAYMDILEDPGEYLSPSDLETEIIKYVNVWNESIDKVKLEKSEDIKICDIETKYTVVSVKLDDELLEEIAVNMLEELRDDKIITELVIDKLGIVEEDEYEEFFDESIDDIKSDYDDDYDDDEDYDRDYDRDYEDEDYKDEDEDYKDEDYEDDDYSLTFKTYIDPTGTIRGFSLKESSDNCMSAIFGIDDDKVRGEVYYKEDGEELFRAELYATGDNEKYTGSIDVIVNDGYYDYEYDEATDDYEEIWVDETTNLSLEFEDFKIVNKEMCYIEGNIVLIVPDVAPIQLDFTSDGKSQDITYQIIVDDTDYGVVTLSYSTTDDCTIDIPSEDESLMIDVENSENIPLSDYVSKEEMADYLTGLFVKLGVDEEFIAADIDEAVDSMYEEFEEGFDDPFSDDYDEYYEEDYLY